MKHSAESTHPGCPALRYIGRFFAVLGILLLAVALLLTGAVALTCKGPSPTARDLFVTWVQQYDSATFLPKLFLSDAEIDGILSANRLMPTNAVTDTTFGFVENEDTDAEPIERIEIKSDKYVGALLVIRDPSRLELACVSAFGAEQPGAPVEDFAKKTGAVAAVSNGSDGVPVGFVIQNGTLLYGSKTEAASMIAFDENNRLIVGRMTAEQALAAGVRNAVCSETYAVIVNGKATEIAGLGDGLHPRAVIGQRADGAVLLMVMESTDSAVSGVLLKDCVRELLKAGAVNAAILDNGDSAALFYENALQNDAPTANDRCAPTAFVVL